MQIDPVLKERLKMIGDVVGTIEINAEFWDPAQPQWQVPNNHTILMLRSYYQQNETDDEFKTSFGKMLDLGCWLYVVFPEWRARLGWITWFLQLYVLDKQLGKEHIPAPPGWEGRWDPEVWTDPRKWMLANTIQGLPIEVSKGTLVTPGGGNDGTC